MPLSIPENIHELLLLFGTWTKRKVRHHIDTTKDNLYFYEGQVWWAALGKNVGFEVDGKNEEFNRPVLILKKYSRYMCFVVPLTTKVKKDLPYYQYKFYVNGRENAANLTQGRTISTKRLLQKEAAISKKKFREIRAAFVELLTTEIKKDTPQGGTEPPTDKDR